ncbi:MAG: helix-turn-helix transcriptional regulator, partial [Spirochaetia bacterium]|nr:helix-turn-helix transcriptional regulator [Spirochaetia bacterium]
DLMLFSSARLQEIARETGYEYYHHFSNQFKKWYGVTPKQFKERVRSGEE